MTREDIEKAAVEARVASASTLTTFGMQRSLDDIMGLAANISLDDLAESAFVKGADWRINSVWHDINKEKPQDGKQCLLEITYNNGYVPYYHLTQWYEMNEFVFHDRCAKVRWTYIEDLLPNMED